MTIDSRFRGPPASANGGYTCGLLAAGLEADTVEVTLRAPPPLERPLELTRAAGSAELRDGETLVAAARTAEPLELELPRPVSLEEAAQARRDSPLHEHHFFPGCFVCGPERDPGDGLGVVPGRVGEDGVVAAPWEVEASLPAADGEVAEEIVWAALDCPSGNALLLDRDAAPAVLGRLTAELSAPVALGSTCVVLGWVLGREGRKLHSASAIFSADGQPLARARALWIELRDEERAAWG